MLEDGRIFWSFGTDKPRPIASEELRRFLAERATMNPNLIALIKVDRKSKYANMVKIVDDLHLTRISRFSLVPLLDHDKK